MKRISSILCALLFVAQSSAQPSLADTNNLHRKESADSILVSTYKKRVLESTEIELMTSFYGQTGSNAAVSGGVGDESLRDFASAIVISVPLNDDDILTIDGNISAYTSASSSNIDPFDGEEKADPFVASSGASSSDVWVNGVGTYSHSSDDRNKVWSTYLSVSNEHDYSSFGFGGSISRLYHEKNTELSLHGSVYLDNWLAIYPVELRPFGANGFGLNDDFFYYYNVTGNKNYQPKFTEFSNTKRNSYSAGISFIQILSKNLQAIFSTDFVFQDGLLSTPFQRVYFSDIADSYIDNFHLADDIERLPNQRLKCAGGTMLNYYINERLILKSYYRYYQDDWGISSNTIIFEMPIKIYSKFTLYPSFRYYDQSAAIYFAPYNRHLSTDEFYTSDYDLSKFQSNQLGLGVTYTDIFTSVQIAGFGLKSLDINVSRYKRNSGLKSILISAGIKLVKQ